MARPKAKPKAKRNPNAGRKPSGLPERVTLMTIKGSPDFKEWLATTHRKTLIPIAAIVRDALAEWAEKRKYPPPPPR